MIAWLWACSVATPPPPPEARHAAVWDELVAAADRGDVVTAKALAQDLDLGPVSDEDPGASKVGAAMGFLQVAEDPEDLADGVEKARAGCVECHRRHNVASPVR